MTTPRVTVPVDVLRELIDASSEVRDLLANVPEMQDRKYVGTGNRFVNAIGAAQRSYLSAAPAPEGGAVDGPGGYLVKDFADGWYWTPNAALDHASGAPVWSVADSRYETDPPALTSGSGDHAELARLAEAASGSDWQTYISGRPEYKNVTHYVEQNPPRDLPFIAEVQEERDAAFIAAANPATVLALLAEIAALRANEKAALKECSEWARKAGEAIGKLETSEAAGIVEGWRDRATEAERKLAEAVGHASWMRNFVPTVWGSTEERLNEIDAFLSKEAERG